METWPLGIQPARVLVSPTGLALRYVHPEKGFRDLVLDLDGSAVRGRWEQGTLTDSSGLARSKTAVLARLGDAEIKALTHTVHESRAQRTPATDSRSNRIATALDLAIQDDTLRSLSLAWEELQSPTPSWTFASKLAVGLLLRLAGRPLEAIELAEGAVELARDADEFEELGPDLALESSSSGNLSEKPGVVGVATPNNHTGGPFSGEEDASHMGFARKEKNRCAAPRASRWCSAPPRAA